MRTQEARGDDASGGPRAEAWRRVEKAIEEGKPKTALEALAGVEQSAFADRAWAEAARAIATRILADTGDRPPDDPERIILLAAAVDGAPAETRGVLRAILANWTWGYFQQNRWRFQQRTAGGAKADDIRSIAEWDLPGIVAEVRRQFAAAVGDAGSPERTMLQGLKVGDWSAIIRPGTMPDAYRPTVWDVVVRDAIEFSSSGERGLVTPEDAFELDAASPALGAPDAFRGWRPERDKAVTDLGSPLLETLRLYRDLLDFHADAADRTAFLAADLDRILWASGVAVSAECADDLRDRKGNALERFIERAGDHETASLARFHLASLLREADSQGGPGDLVEARSIADRGAAAHPKTAGGAMCANLVAQIDARELSVQTERSWAAPWPVVRVGYRNLSRVHLRLARADWMARLVAGRPPATWFDDDDRKAILSLPAVKTAAIDLPATPDHRHRHHDVPVAAALAADTLEPGAYWVIASHTDDFGAQDNVVHAALVWVGRLAIVVEQTRQVVGDADAAVAAKGPVSGHVVDLASGEPVAGATVKPFVRDRQGNRNRFVEGAAATTDKDGRFEIGLEQSAEYVLAATAALDGRKHEATTDAAGFWRNLQPAVRSQIVLVTDRGIHRPGQTVFYKGIACASDVAKGEYRAVAGREIDVVLRDANGREVAKARHTTTANGSFHGEFPLATAALPGQWSIAAQAAGPGGFSGGVGVRVEEYKRPKFLVTLAAPEKSVPLGGIATLSGTATSYTGISVADAKVRWRVERTVRWPAWCRWLFPGLPFGGGSQRIARGTAITDQAGRFTISFPLTPDRSVPRESLPIFSYRIVADVTDSSGETRSDERLVQAGYTDVDATMTADDWQATGADGKPAAVAITLATATLDGLPRRAAGTLTVSRLVQPADVVRADLLPTAQQPRPNRGRRDRTRVMPPAPVDAANPETWAAGEAVFSQRVETDPATGKAVATASLPAGVYRAVFEIQAAGDGPAVKAQRLIEVLDPAAERYGVKRPLAVVPQKRAVLAGEEFLALVGTGHDRGRALVEISQSGRVLERFWTTAGRTQWPVRMKVSGTHRGGFTVRAWLVRDGRLSMQTQTIDVPWTDKKLAITWERFTRRLEPGSKEVWRATVSSAADPLTGPAAPAVAEMLAVLYDQSLDALAPHAWPTDGLMGLFRHESDWLNLTFTNAGESFSFLRGEFSSRTVAVPDTTFREFRDPFGSPQRGGFGFGRSRMLRGMLGGGAELAMPMAAAAPADAVKDFNADRIEERRAAGDEFQLKKQDGAPPAPKSPSPSSTPAAPPPRRNLAETAFFLPALASGKDGAVTIEFTLPDTLTTWQFKGLAHDAALRSGTIVDQCITAKDLMVEPVMPRFFREGDVVQIPVKVSNRSNGRLSGIVRLTLTDARTDDSRDGLVDGPRELPFDLAAGESKPSVFTVRVADGTDVLRYLATGSAGRAADGEEALIPVLPRRVPVTETVPVTIRGPGSRQVVLERLAKDADGDIRSQSLVVQAASNPAWYAVLALPSIIEETDESTETLFTRLYANALTRHLATSDPRIARVFEQWRLAAGQGGRTLESPLEKNGELMATLLAETPWVRDAVDERESRARIAMLFDATRAGNEQQTALVRLESLRNGDGGWPWFPGGQTCDSVTLGILAGFGRLRAAGAIKDVQPALATVPWLDGRLVEERRRAEKLVSGGKESIVLTDVGVYALYARSFFTQDSPPQGDAAAAIAWAFDVGRTSWMKLDSRRSQGHLAIALARSGDRATALSIIDSLRQRAVDAAVAPGEEKASWQGMWWRDRHPGWWSWAYAPIATQAIMIEAFDEVAGDKEAVEALKVWLLSQKRTSRWPGSRATADAVGALLTRGDDLLGGRETVTVDVGGERVKPTTVEAGTGFFETRFVKREIQPGMATITLTKPDKGLAWGGVHWQYLDDIAAVAAAGREELSIEKRLFVKRFTKDGPRLEQVGADAATPVELGDELVVRLVVKSDRDYDFLELSDHRPSLTEPLDVLSGWRWGDGAGWYVAIRDASTRMFFERLPRGTHVLEYSLRASHRGTASSGFATIQSRYAPEFSAHSASIPLSVR